MSVPQSTDETHAASSIRRIEREEADAYRALRLLALRTSPESIGDALEDEVDQPLPWFEKVLYRNLVLGAFQQDQLVGMAGLKFNGNIKLSHKAQLWGVFVHPEARGRQVGRKLVLSALRAAQARVEQVGLKATSASVAAVRMYRSLGFETYGVESRALKVGDRYHDELLMAIRLDRPRSDAAGRQR